MTLGLGTAALGRPEYINIRHGALKKSDLKAFKANSLEVLNTAYNLGVRYFDTAPGYGLAEDLLLEWLQTKNDSSIQIATKWGYTYVANFDPAAQVHEVKEHTLSKLNQQWQTSIQFKNHLKLYQIHSATLETGVLDNEAVLCLLAKLKLENGFKIGITTTGINQTEVIKKALDVEVNGQSLFDAFQVTYNILDQSLISISDTIIAEGKGVIIKEAVANGRLISNSNYSHYIPLYSFLNTLAKKHEVTTDAIALAFCQQTIPKSMVLSGVSNSMHLKSNLKAATVVLSYDELKKLQTFSTNLESYWNERKALVWN